LFDDLRLESISCGINSVEKYSPMKHYFW